MKKLLLFIVAISLVGGTAMAQISFGPKIGGNLSKYAYNFDDSDFEPDAKFRFGNSVGAVVDMPLLDFLSFQPSLLFSVKGSAYDLEEMNPNHEYDGFMRDRVMYTEIPLNFAAKLELGPGSAQVFLGPYVAMAFSGKSISKYDVTLQDGTVTKVDEIDDIKFRNTVSEDDIEDNEDASWMRPLDYGLSFGVGYQWNALLFNLGYQMGLANLTPDYEDSDGFDRADYKVKNTSLFFSVAWLFGGE